MPLWQTPADLPNVALQYPVVLPQVAPDGRAASARLAAASAHDGVSPATVATASGIIAAVVALNLSVLRRLRRQVS
jgi:hypothetical protein